MRPTASKLLQPVLPELEPELALVLVLVPELVPALELVPVLELVPALVLVPRRPPSVRLPVPLSSPGQKPFFSSFSPPYKSIGAKLIGKFLNAYHLLIVFLGYYALL